MPAGDLEQRNEVIGENIRRYRLQKGLTQEELADGICSISQLSKAETGKVDLKASILRSITSRLGVTLEQINSVDPVLDELQETYEMAEVLGFRNENSWPLVQQVIHTARKFGYWELFYKASYARCDALFWANKHTECIVILQEILTAGYPLTPYQTANVNLHLFEACRHMGDFATAFEYCHQAEQDIGSKPGNPREELQVCMGLSKGYRFMGNMHKSLHYAERAYELAVELNMVIAKVRSLCLCGHAYRLLGKLELAEKSFQTALQKAKVNALTFDVGFVTVGLGRFYHQTGNTALAISNYRRAIKLFEVSNYHSWILEPLAYLAELEFAEGDLEQATENALKIFRTAEQVNLSANLMKGWACRILGRVRAIQGDFEGFVRHFEQGIEWIRDEFVSYDAYDLCIELADALYQRQDPRALAVYRQAMVYSQKMTMYERLIK